MRNISFISTILIGLSVAISGQTKAQNAIEGVIVETYYVSDANDAGHDDEGTNLPEGSITYRIFLDLAPGYRVTGIFGDEFNPLSIRSTELIWNHSERGAALGSDLNDSRLDENTVVLDSYITIGAASDAHFGIPKELDNDGSIIGGLNNDGGSEMVEEGLLVNTTTAIGIPLTEADGLIEVSEDEIPNILFSAAPNLVPIFDNETIDNSYFSLLEAIQFTDGIAGVTEENIVMLAQITTLGELEFDFNVKLKSADNEEFIFVSDTVTGGDTLLSPFLSFPPECGCTDPDFLEYNPSAPCDDGSCATLIVFGCSDPEACNFNPDANFNIPELCCFGIDDCNNLDWTIICPSLSTDDPSFQFDFKLYPNPATSELWVAIASANEREAELSMYTLQGQLIRSQRVQIRQGEQELKLDCGDLPQGTYLVRLHDEFADKTSLLIKN
jgi:hypothetical protein